MLCACLYIQWMIHLFGICKHLCIVERISEQHYIVCLLCSVTCVGFLLWISTNYSIVHPFLCFLHAYIMSFPPCTCTYTGPQNTLIVVNSLLRNYTWTTYGCILCCLLLFSPSLSFPSHFLPNIQPYNLQQHISAFHKKEKLFQCPHNDCNASFSTKV